MAALNEAYRVLRNPGRRAVYDADLAARRDAGRQEAIRQPARPAAAPLVRIDDRAPARYPWKLAVVAAVLGSAAVLMVSALYEPAEPARPDNVLQPGSCVAIEANGDAREVTCRETADDLVVAELVAFDGVCPPGLSAYRDRQGMGFACVAPRSASTSSPS